MIENRIVEVGEANPATLLANEKNWRTHPTRQRGAMEAVLDEVGWVQNVIVNRVTGRLVDGHLRVAVATERGEKVIPVTYVELSEEEEAKVLATLDPIAAMAGTDQTALNALIEQVSTDTDALTDLLADLYVEESESLDGADSVDFGDLGSPIIQYTIIFDNEEQQETFYKWAKHLRNEYPNADTLAERLFEHIQALNLED